MYERVKRHTRSGAWCVAAMASSAPTLDRLQMNREKVTLFQNRLSSTPRLMEEDRRDTKKHRRRGERKVDERERVEREKRRRFESDTRG